MKAVIVSRGGIFATTHNIQELLEMSTDVRWTPPLPPTSGPLLVSKRSWAPLTGIRSSLLVPVQAVVPVAMLAARGAR